MRKRTRSGFLAAALVALFSGTALANWQDYATPADRDRLSRFEEAKSRAIAEAAGGGDMGVIRSVADPVPQATSASALIGNWRCRTIKLGGISPSVVYDWFRCRISQGSGGRLYFEKLTGSQRTSGYLYPDYRDGFVYLGASTVKGEPQRVYSGTGASYGANATQDDQIGVLSYIGPGHARLEMPYPIVESTFDILELRR